MHYGINDTVLTQGSMLISSDNFTENALSGKEVLQDMLRYLMPHIMPVPGSRICYQ